MIPSLSPYILLSHWKAKTFHHRSAPIIRIWIVSKSISCFNFNFLHFQYFCHHFLIFSFCFLVEVYFDLTRPRSLYFSVTKEFQCSPSRIILLLSYVEVEAKVMTFMFSLPNIRTHVKYHPRVRALFDDDTLK